MLLISFGPARSHHSKWRRGEGEGAGFPTERLVPVLRVAFSLTSFWSKCEERLLCVSPVSEEGGWGGTVGQVVRLGKSTEKTMQAFYEC